MIIAAIVPLASCGNASAPAAVPQPPSYPAGIIVGAVTASGISFITTTASADITGHADPATYGSQNVTMNVHSTSFSIDSVTTPGTKVWSIGVGLRNLLAYPIGANQGAISPQDTLGVFAFFSVLPVVTKPSSCACTVTVANAMGAGNFTGMTQPYFWYPARLQAAPSASGLDSTTSNPVWKFSGPKTVTAFTFVLLISTAWPPSQESQWGVSYVASTDSNPNTQADPRWKATHFEAGIGSSTWAATGLTLNSTPGGDIIEARNDSLSSNEQAVFDISMQAKNANAGKAENVFGFFDPGYFVIGIAKDQVGFVIPDVSQQWVFTGTTYPFPASGGNATQLHHYRLRKYGRDSTRLCVDNVAALKITGAPSLLSSSSTTVTEFFGAASQTGPGVSIWMSAAYTLGAAGSGCS
jgi:hypothetical protein